MITDDWIAFSLSPLGILLCLLIGALIGTIIGKAWGG